MSYDFKRLSDVEVVAEPAESANVLIEEDGVIKKASKDAVGGGGVTSWNDLTNKPFYTGEPVETVLFDGDVQCIGAFSNLTEFVFNAGTTYTVVVDGVTYSAVAENQEVEGVNINVLMVPDAGLGFMGAVRGFPASVYTLDESDRNFTLKLTGFISPIHTIDEKYLPIMDANRSGIISLERLLSRTWRWEIRMYSSANVKRSEVTKTLREYNLPMFRAEHGEYIAVDFLFCSESSDSDGETGYYNVWSPFNGRCQLWCRWIQDGEDYILDSTWVVYPYDYLITSPNGTEYSIMVSDSGELTVNKLS